MLDNTPIQPTKFRTKNWVETNDGPCGTYNTNSQIKFKILMIKSNLCDYSYAYTVVSGTITIPNTWTVANLSNRKNIIIKICSPFTDCKSEISNTQIDNTKEIDIVMPMHNSIEYSGNYSKISGGLRQYYRDKPFLDFPADNDNSA